MTERKTGPADTARMEEMAKKWGHVRQAPGAEPAAAAPGQEKKKEMHLPPQARIMMKQFVKENSLKRAGTRFENGYRAAEDPRKKPNRREHEFMIDLMLLRNALAVRRDAVRERLKEADPNGWRDLQLIYTLVCKLQDTLLKTMPETRQDYYYWFKDHARYRVETEGVIRKESVVPIRDSCLAAVLEAAMESECLMCMRDGKAIDQCPLREALEQVAPPAEVRDAAKFGCEYRGAAGQLVRGENVNI